MSKEHISVEKGKLGAIFMYGGILDAYETVGTELIGSAVLEEHVIPKMIYYVEEFLPELFSDRQGDQEQLTTELLEFMIQFQEKINDAREKGTARDFTMEEVWRIRAAIFGYESVFIDILGEQAIKNYVFKRVADILSAYLPEAFQSEKLSLKEKMTAYIEYLKNQEFVKHAGFKIKENIVKITANHCAFAKIHDSEAYRQANVRFCPWGMIGSAILTSHKGAETTIKSCIFTTKGSITDIEERGG